MKQVKMKKSDKIKEDRTFFGSLLSRLNRTYIWWGHVETPAGALLFTSYIACYQSELGN